MTWWLVSHLAVPVALTLRVLFDLVYPKREGMKYTLDSGAWIEMKSPDDLTAGDKMAMHASTELPMSGNSLSDFADGGGRFSFSLGTIDEQLYGVLARIIQGWSYPYVLPKDDDTKDERGRPVYEDSLKRLPLDDWNEIEDITEPHMVKLRGTPKGGRTTSTSSPSS